MPRFRQVSEILKLMGNKESIRNLGIIAHIDHGKTTLTDSLLAGTGLLSPTMVGYARVLDYLEEEQRRGITMKAANISLLYQTREQPFIINLVDTPGHVDFTGKVTRALRSIDGAIVVVDAVEEIMPQTEIVVRQALEERVCPILFINKTDKLMTELKLNLPQIERRLNRIIDAFNDLIELYAESLFKSKWKINPKKDTVVFGSALHRWGFTLTEAKKKGVKFNDIANAYLNKEHEKLSKTIPLHETILIATINKIPNPREAQKYRAEKIWKGNPSSTIGQGIINCDDASPVVMNITNVQTDQSGNAIATGRVFSGTVRENISVYLVNARAKGVIEKVALYMGAFREPVGHVDAGNLAALSGLENVKAGETVVDLDHHEGIVPFERIRYLSEPVLTVALEPKNPKAFPLFLSSLETVVAEDPNLVTTVNRETGEYLLSGMGELHLETATKHLRDLLKEAEISASPPKVVYKECITEKGIVATARSPNKKNKFAIQVEPLDEGLAKLIEQDQINPKKIGDVLAIDDDKNVLADCTEKKGETRNVFDLILSGFEYACRAGPLCGEPLRTVKTNLIEVHLSGNPEERGSVEITHAIGKATFASFLSAKPRLLEPIYKSVINVPTEAAAECSRMVNRRRGKVTIFEQKGTLAMITCLIPVAETLGLSQELRSATSGRAFWQSTFSHWEKIPERMEAKIITDMRARKGLPNQIPKPDQFMETEK